MKADIGSPQVLQQIHQRDQRCAPLNKLCRTNSCSFNLAQRISKEVQRCNIFLHSVLCNAFLSFGPLPGLVPLLFLLHGLFARPIDPFPSLSRRCAVTSAAGKREKSEMLHNCFSHPLNCPEFKAFRTARVVVVRGLDERNHANHRQFTRDAHTSRQSVRITQRNGTVIF